MFNGRATLNTNTKPHRDWVGFITISMMGGATAFFCSGKFIDLFHIFPNSFFSHIWLLITDPDIYINHISNFKMKAFAFYLIPISTVSASIYGCWLYFGRLIDPSTLIEGRTKKEGAAAAKASAAATAAEVKFSGYGLKIHENLTFARHQELTSFLFLAGQRGGKTQIISRLLQAILARAGISGDRCIIFDIVKADFTMSTPPNSDGSEPIIFAPWDTRSAVWSISADVTDEIGAKAFASGMIPLSDSDNPMWANAARSVLVTAIMSLIHTHDKNWGWAELCDVCYNKTIQELKELAELHYLPAKRNIEDAESKTTQSIITNFNAFLEPVYFLSKYWGDAPKSRRFSLVRWLRNDDSKYKNIIIQGNQSQQHLSQSYMKSMIELMVSTLLRPDFPQSKNRRIWWILDEVAQLGKVDSLLTIPETLASRGCGLIFACQSFSQLIKIYGKDSAAIFNAVLQTKIFGKIIGEEEQQYVLGQLGKRKIRRLNKTVSGQGNGQVNVSQNYTYDEENVMHASELEQLGPIAKGAAGKESKVSEKFIKAIVLGHGKDPLVLEWPLLITKEWRPGSVMKTLTPPTIPAAPLEMVGQDNPSPPVGERQAALGSVTSLPDGTRQTESTPTVSVDEETQTSEMLTILNSFPTPETQLLDEKGDTPEDEILGNVAESIGEHVLADAIGIPSAAIDLFEMLDNLQSPETQNIPDAQIITTHKKRERKARKYHENSNQQ